MCLINYVFVEEGEIMPWQDVISFEEVQDIMAEFLKTVDSIESELKLLKELRQKFLEFVEADKNP